MKAARMALAALALFAAACAGADTILAPEEAVHDGVIGSGTATGGQPEEEEEEDGVIGSGTATSGQEGGGGTIGSGT